jgi:hypothetical protein
MPTEKPTSIKLKPSTRDRLAEFGKKTETFDEIVNRLLNEIETCRKSTVPPTYG